MYVASGFALVSLLVHFIWARTQDSWMQDLGHGLWALCACLAYFSPTADGFWSWLGVCVLMDMVTRAKHYLEEGGWLIWWGTALLGVSYSTIAYILITATR